MKHNVQVVTSPKPTQPTEKGGSSAASAEEQHMQRTVAQFDAKQWHGTTAMDLRLGAGELSAHIAWRRSDTVLEGTGKTSVCRGAATCISMAGACYEAKNP